jgi:hypothetical protein
MITGSDLRQLSDDAIIDSILLKAVKEAQTGASSVSLQLSDREYTLLRYAATKRGISISKQDVRDGDKVIISW